MFLGLFWLYTCLHLNRQILAILAESVKSDLHLSDADLGVLNGSAFSIVYALWGLFFGRLADAADRLVMVRIGACTWSIASLGGAFAHSYWQLIVARAGVAGGEAIATAAAVSLMAELVGERRRAQAASVFFAGAFLGAGLAAVGGGTVVDCFRDSSTIPGWRAAFALASLPGFLGASYVGFFRWPIATSVAPAPVGGSRLMPVWLFSAAAFAVIMQIWLPARESGPVAVAIAAIASLLWVHHLRLCSPDSFRATVGQASFRWLLLGFAAVLFMDFATSFWLLPFAQRRYAVSAAMAGALLGGLIIVGGIAGSLMGGLVADRWRRRNP